MPPRATERVTLGLQKKSPVSETKKLSGFLCQIADKVVFPFVQSPRP